MAMLRSSSKLRNWLAAATLVAGLSIGGSIVLAQDGTTPTPPTPPPGGATPAQPAQPANGNGEPATPATPATPPADTQTDAARKYATFTDAEIKSNTTKMYEELEKAYQRVVQIRENERKKRPIDTIKLNCVNEHLVTLSESAEIVIKNVQQLKVALTAGDKDTRNDIYADIVIAHDLGMQAAASAEQCIGEDLSYIGDTDVEVEGGGEPDDPTQPSEPDFPEIDFPPIASAFL